MAVVEEIPPTGAHIGLSPTKAVLSVGPGCEAIIHGCVPESLVRNSHFQSNNNLQARHFAASS